MAVPRHRPKRCPSFLALIAAACIVFPFGGCREQEVTRQERLSAAWKGYKKGFLVKGRVIRPQNKMDTVSEGQAYAMVRAVWMNDKETFDQCYRWTEKHLSRQNEYGDHLLAWRYGISEDGREKVLDWNAASDADLDYALALFLASNMWLSSHPPALMDYKEKATKVAADILRKEVFTLPAGELVLGPWPGESEEVKNGDRIVNPSYFSPAHYRMFFQETRNDAWEKLIDDTYAQLDRLMQRLADQPGVGLVPDWCLIDANGFFSPSDEHGTISSWDAFRVWWRVGLDWRLHKEQRAKRLIEKYLTAFLRKERFIHKGHIYVEYDYGGKVLKPYESPAVIGVYAWAVRDLDADMFEALLESLNKYVIISNTSVFYGDKSDYYVNSWAWYADTAERKIFPFVSREE